MPSLIDAMHGWIGGDPVWPYTKIIETWPTLEMYRRRFGRDLSAAMTTGILELQSDTKKFAEDSYANFRLRDEYIVKFGFAIPCAELLDALALYVPIVEVGAGSGYMTRLMLNRGIDVIGSNPKLDDYSFEHGKYAVLTLRQAKTMARGCPDATIFCSWPTLNATWFRQMLKAMKIGQRLVVIREEACAERTAWDYLDDCFDEIETISIPTFNYINDYAGVYLKKRQRAKP